MKSIDIENKAVRHELYKKALEHFIDKKSVSYGLCYALLQGETFLSTGKFNNSGWWGFGEQFINIIYYPEIIKHEPEIHGTYWFPLNEEGTEKRISILQQAIKETE